jgi:hypothetical protein
MTTFNHYLFNIPNHHIYPPFKNGLYLEEYFIKKINEENPLLKRIYIPIKWTNFQIRNDFVINKNKMQVELDEFVKRNPSVNGYFTVVQYDDGPLLKLPENTYIYSACYYRDEPIPLIYEDINNTLESLPRKKFSDKKILCSFIGTMTHSVRITCKNKFVNNSNFKIIDSGGWTPEVNKNNQDIFINATLDSKFALGPRGYGKSSFRYYEIFLLGTIPIYIWDDICHLPYKNELDYDKFSITININEIDKLENILLNINEDKYNTMLDEYNKIKHWFTLEGMYKYIINKEQIIV